MLFFNVAMEFSACQEELYDVLFGKNVSPAVCAPPPATYIYKKWLVGVIQTSYLFVATRNVTMTKGYRRSTVFSVVIRDVLILSCDSTGKEEICCFKNSCKWTGKKLSFHSPCRAVMNSLPLQVNSLHSNFKFNHGGMTALQQASFSAEGRWYKVKWYKKDEAKQFIAKRASAPEGIAPFWALSSFCLLHLLLPWPCSLTPRMVTAGLRWMCPQRAVTQMSCPSASSFLKFGVQVWRSSVWRTCFSSPAAFKL